MYINENEMNRGFKVFYFCYTKEMDRKLEQAGVKPILRAKTINNNYFSLYWQSNKVKAILKQTKQ
ncbi:Uncharacterised protein [Mycobacteroides abscessus subsp. abscessus]|nr:Uncharacterised protein [Mycobacteroides abscessus subsp. abscessus]